MVGHGVVSVMSGRSVSSPPAGRGIAAPTGSGALSSSVARAPPPVDVPVAVLGPDPPAAVQTTSGDDHRHARADRRVADEIVQLVRIRGDPDTVQLTAPVPAVHRARRGIADVAALHAQRSDPAADLEAAALGDVFPWEIIGLGPGNVIDEVPPGVDGRPRRGDSPGAGAPRSGPHGSERGRPSTAPRAPRAQRP